MSNISIKYADIKDTTNIIPSRIVKTPVISALRSYWDGTDEEYDSYLKSIDIDPNQHFNSMFELDRAINGYDIEEQHIPGIIDKLKTAMKDNNVGKFNFKVTSAISSRYFKNVDERDYACLWFGIEDYQVDEDKNLLQNVFLKAENKAFVSYSVVDDKNLVLIYNRKSIVEDENEEVKVLTARSKITLSEAAASKKDTNFICSAICLELAKTLKSINRGNDTISFSYENSAGPRLITMSANKIIEDSLKSADERKAIARQEELKQAAKDEVKAEMNERRDSLKAESVNTEILKATGSQPRFDTSVLGEEPLSNESLERETNKIFDEQMVEDYKLMELEKTRLKLEKGQKDAPGAYNIIKDSIKKGVSFSDAVNYVKQKFNNQHTLDLAMVMITKDLAQAQQKDNEISRLKQDIQTSEIEKEKLAEVIERTEHKAREMQSAVTKKSHEMLVLTDSYEKTLKDMEVSAKQKISEVAEKFKTELDEANQLIDEQSIAITRLTADNKALKGNNDELKEDYKKVIAQEAETTVELEMHKIKANEYKEQLAQYKPIMEEKDREISLLHTRIQELSRQEPNEEVLKENLSLKQEIQSLKEKIKSGDSQIVLLNQRIAEQEKQREEDRTMLETRIQKMFDSISSFNSNSEKEKNDIKDEKNDIREIKNSRSDIKETYEEDDIFNFTGGKNDLNKKPTKQE